MGTGIQAETARHDRQAQHNRSGQSQSSNGNARGNAHQEKISELDSLINNFLKKDLGATEFAGQINDHYKPEWLCYFASTNTNDERENDADYNIAAAIRKRRDIIEKLRLSQGIPKKLKGRLISRATKALNVLQAAPKNTAESSVATLHYEKMGSKIEFRAGANPAKIKTSFKNITDEDVMEIAGETPGVTITGIRPAADGQVEFDLHFQDDPAKERFRTALMEKDKEYSKKEAEESNEKNELKATAETSPTLEASTRPLWTKNKPGHHAHESSEAGPAPSVSVPRTTP